MKNKIIFLAFIILAFTLAFSTFSLSGITKRAYQQFSIIIPDMVTVYPGDTVKLEGEVMNTGYWWLHDFDLVLNGLPEGYEYVLTPERWEHLKILREWDSETGLYRIGEPFTLTIKVPQDAYGAQLLNLTGQEHRSWKKITNSTIFWLKVIPQANFTITDLVIPEKVNVDEPFTISMKVSNVGLNKGTIDISAEIPEDWKIDEAKKSLVVDANSFEAVNFSITPTNTSGQIKIFASYPHKEAVINITKVGSLLIPVEKEIETTTTIAPTTGFSVLLDWLQTQVATLNPLVTGIIILLAVIIIWEVVSIFSFKKGRGKEEKVA